MSQPVPTGRTTAEAKADLDGILRKIQGLLNKADGTDNEHEAQACQEMAEKLMRKYRIEQEHLIAADPVSVAPIAETIVLGTADTRFPSEYLSMFGLIAHHVGARARYAWAGRDLTARVVGYESDVRYAAMLYASARMVFQEKLEPKIKPELSDAENCYRLRSAGIERNRIARLLWDLDTHAAHAKVGHLYKQAAIARGEDPALNGREINAKTYRQAYARNFVQHLATRLREARDAADGGSGAMVLHGRQERVDEAFYERYPEFRPTKETAVRRECADCAKTKHSSGQCRAHRALTWTKADEARWQREHYSASAEAGQSAGREAASQVQLSRVESSKRLGEDPLRGGMRSVTGLELES